MLNREDVRRILSAREKVSLDFQKKGVELEDVTFRDFLEAVLKETCLIEKLELKNPKREITENV